jgi:hypothetical protein
VTATVSGDYVGDYSFERGVFGKYIDNFSTQVGICAPAQCTTDDIEKAYTPLLTRYAEEAYWDNTVVKYNNVSDHNTQVARHVSSDKAIVIVLILLMLVFVTAATCVHLFSCGNRENAQAEIFKNTEQYE